MKTPSVSIVIPAYNEAARLRACLDAIAAQTTRPLEVIVVDNNSADETVAIARRYPFVRVIFENRQGIGFARSAGFDAAKGDIIGRIDADVTLPPGWVAHVQAFYSDARHATWAWTGSGVFNNVRLGRFINWAYQFLVFRFNWLLLGHVSLWGSNMAITAEQWRAVTKTICKRRDIHEDLDLSIHLAEAGYHIAYDAHMPVTASLKRGHVDRSHLWSYLQWWPRTYRVHGKWTWPICWFFGVLMLYLAVYAQVVLDRAVRHLKRSARPTGR